MKRRFFIPLAGLLSICVLGGCGETKGSSGEQNEAESTFAISTGSQQTADASKENTAEATESSETQSAAEEDNAEKSLAERMVGKYAYHSTGGNEDEYYIMNVVNFGDNLYAYCGKAMPDEGSYEAYSFWATEFIPFDADDMSSTDADKVKVNALSFSIMSNAGMYWDAGHEGTITFTDEGLVFEGFDREGFLVPDDSNDSRLFSKNEMVEDFFSYLKDDKAAGDEKLQGYWRCEEGDTNLYVRFAGPNMYIYEKDPSKEVFFASGGCEFRDGSFDFMGNTIDSGGQPFEFTADYKVEGDSLAIAIQGSDAPSSMQAEARYERISEKDIHVTTMDEVVFGEDSFGAYGQMMKEPFYGLWVDAFKNEDDARDLVSKLQALDLPATYVYSCDWANMNKDPYYCVTIGRSETKAEAESYKDAAKSAGYGSAYVKHTGDYIGSSEYSKAEDALKEMADYLCGFMWATMMTKSDYNAKEADNITLDLTDEDKMRAAVLSCDSDFEIDSTFVLGMGGFSEDKNADDDPDGDGFHGSSVAKENVESRCRDLFGMKANWDELPIGPVCDLYDAVKYNDGKNTYALIVERVVETETALANYECSVSEKDGKYIGKVNMFWGYWGEMDSKPGYSNYVATYTLEPNDQSEYGMVIRSISIKRK